MLPKSPTSTLLIVDRGVEDAIAVGVGDRDVGVAVIVAVGLDQVDRAVVVGVVGDRLGVAVVVGFDQDSVCGGSGCSWCSFRGARRCGLSAAFVYLERERAGNVPRLSRSRSVGRRASFDECAPVVSPRRVSVTQVTIGGGAMTPGRWGYSHNAAATAHGHLPRRRGALLVSTMLVSAPATAANHWFPDIFESSVPKADCGPGSRPEPGLQGDVSAEDRLSGRSMRGYHCNLTKLGNVTGAGGGIVSASFEHCSYTGSLFPRQQLHAPAGVQVIDASDPRKPRVVGSLTDTAMRGGTWETLKVNKKRKLLAATGVPLLWGGAGFFAVYDISDCTRPKLLNARGGGIAYPIPFTSHEGGWSPDGRTYWASGGRSGAPECD